MILLSYDGTTRPKYKVQVHCQQKPYLQRCMWVVKYGTCFVIEFSFTLSASTFGMIYRTILFFILLDRQHVYVWIYYTVIPSLIFLSKPVHQLSSGRNIVNVNICNLLCYPVLSLAELKHLPIRVINLIWLSFYLESYDIQEPCSTSFSLLVVALLDIVYKEMMMISPNVDVKKEE